MCIYFDIVFKSFVNYAQNNVLVVFLALFWCCLCFSIFLVYCWLATVLKIFLQLWIFTCIKHILLIYISPKKNYMYCILKINAKIYIYIENRFY